MRTIVVFVVLACCVAGAYSSILEEQHKEKLRQIRNVCALESNINPYDIGIAKRAIGPAKKLVRASHCVVQKLTELQDDEIVQEIIVRTKTAIADSSLPKVVAQVVKVCGNLLRQDVCQKVLELVGVIIENVKNPQ